MNKPLFLFVGRSASGKTTIANMLENNDKLNQIQSYTTRLPRYENEPGHVFITNEEYDKLENIMASTVYNGNHYCTTLDQIKAADIYVVDVPGVQTLLDNYERLNRLIHIILFEASTYCRIQRMLERGDSDTHVVRRLLIDEEYDWFEKLKETIYEHNVKVPIHSVNADNDLQVVYYQVKNIIETVQCLLGRIS